MARESPGWSSEEAWGRVSTAIAILFATPVGWLLLPVIMISMALCAALCVALLPTVLSLIGAGVIRRRPVRHRPLWMVAVVALGILLNLGLWHTVYHAWLASQAAY